jgi:hypothetical protein
LPKGHISADNSGMGTIAGYSIIFTSDDGRVRQFTVAQRDDAKIEEMLNARFVGLLILARTALDANVLRLLDLEPGQLMEWLPIARKRSS